MLRTLRTATPAEGHERVLYPGLSEHEELIVRRAKGIPLHKEVIQWFGEIHEGDGPRSAGHPVRR